MKNWTLSPDRPLCSCRKYTSSGLPVTHHFITSRQNNADIVTNITNVCYRGNFLDRLGRPYKKGAPCSLCSKHCRLKKLCTNTCPSADLWANCQELNATWHNWLCNHQTSDGRDRHRHCSATCNCHGKII